MFDTFVFDAPPKPDPKRWFVWALIAEFSANTLDILSTLLVGKFVPQAFETNELVRDDNGNFLIGPGLEVKIIHILVGLLLAFFIYKGSKSAKWASLPLWYHAYGTFGAVFGNFALLATQGIFHR